MSKKKPTSKIKGGAVDSTIAIPSELRQRFKAWTATRALSMASVLREVLEGVIEGRIVIKGVPVAPTVRGHGGAVRS